MTDEIKPRQHAKTILGLKTKEARNAYLGSMVPEHLRNLVMSHVKIWWPKRKGK